MDQLTSDFFYWASLQNFQLINLTNVLDLHNRWQSSISDLEILIFNEEEISMTSTGIPCILVLFV